MGGTFESLNSLIMIFIMIVPGIFLSTRNVISLEQSNGLSSIIVNLTWPCLVIDAMQIPFSKGILKECGYTFVIMIVVFFASFLIGHFIGKLLKIKAEQRYLLMFMLIFANTGFIGIPVINALYGKETVFYASIVEMVNDIFLFTVGIILIQMSAGASKKIDLKLLLSPGMLGIIIGFMLFLFNFQLPGFIGDSVSLLGSATTPLTMIVIGLQIGRMPFKELIGDKNIYIMVLFKLIVIPAIVFVIMIFILKDTSMLSKVIILDCAMPVATCASIFSQQYKGEVAFATKGVLLSTVLSIATIPLFSVLLSFF